MPAVHLFIEIVFDRAGMDCRAPRAPEFDRTRTEPGRIESLKSANGCLKSANGIQKVQMDVEGVHNLWVVDTIATIGLPNRSSIRCRPDVGPYEAHPTRFYGSWMGFTNQILPSEPGDPA